VRRVPRFVEALQASVSTSKLVLAHLKSSTSEQRRLDKSESVVKQLELKQKVLDAFLKEHPEVGYSDLYVDEDHDLP